MQGLQWLVVVDWIRVVIDNAIGTDATPTGYSSAARQTG
jgi:hypothetical protein